MEQVSSFDRFVTLLIDLTRKDFDFFKFIKLQEANATGFELLFLFQDVLCDWILFFEIDCFKLFFNELLDFRYVKSTLRLLIQIPFVRHNLISSVSLHPFSNYPIRMILHPYFISMIHCFKLFILSVSFSLSVVINPGEACITEHQQISWNH